MKQTSAFSIAHLKPLIIGRGPVRLEALEVFAAQGITQMGLLLSRKDSWAFPYGQAPELRCLPPGCAVHGVDEYGPNSQAYIQSLVELCLAEGYNAVFAGYGFLAEEPALAAAVQAAGLIFIGPSASVSCQAGAKDTAKITAQAVGASVVPGINTLLGYAALQSELKTQAAAEIKFDDARLSKAQAWVEAELQAQRQPLTDASIAKAAFGCMQQLWRDYPTYDLRLKAIQGGGGKGQRVLGPDTALPQVVQALQGIWAEVGVNTPFANKNCVIELNIPVIRHWEIQLIGNGDWCMALGGRDCSLQRFEQKLVEFSLTEASLAQDTDDSATLKTLEAEAIAFGQAVGLDSVSTYEAIITINSQSKYESAQQPQHHFFMEMNTRLQVEHRVSELVYGLEFPLKSSSLKVESLIHLMCLLAVFGKRLPKPKRYPLATASVEVRINAMNNALKPAVGGVLQAWSAPIPGELRDDQGLSRPNRDTGMPMSYALTGAYDSNLALSLVTGSSRAATIAKMLDTLGAMRLQGRSLETNIPVLIGVLAVLKHTPTTSISTHWMLGYLDMAANVQAQLCEPWMQVLNPHRVIAWFFESNLELLWQGPGGFTPLQLSALRAIWVDLGDYTTIQGQLVGPKPPKPAEILLDPPPAITDFSIKAPSGGLYYAQPSPGAQPFVTAGQKVNKGDTLGIIEVMKMFNPVYAPLNMTITTIASKNMSQIQKGEVLFEFSLN